MQGPSKSVSAAEVYSYWPVGLYETQVAQRGCFVGGEACLLERTDILSLKALVPYILPVAPEAQPTLPLTTPHNGESHR